MKREQDARVNALVRPILERARTPVEEITEQTLLQELQEARLPAIVTGNPRQWPKR